MKKMVKRLGIAAFTAMLIFVLVACEDEPKAQPQSKDSIVNIAAIQGVTIPVTGATPVGAIDNAQYSGTVTYKVASSGSVHTGAFFAATQYTATITLTAKSGYTLQGVTANFFTVAGAMSVSNSANSGVITVVFPATVSTDGSFTHQVTIDMYDSYGDGWNGCALRININGINLSSNATISSGSSGSYTFNVVSGDSVSIYWVSGDYQDECSFIVYYTDTPPSPAFTTSNNDYWNGANALVYELQGTMNGISGGTLLGSFTVQNGNIDVDTIIDIAAIQGVTVPVTGEIPVTSITENEQYSGTVTWSGNPSVFAAETQYTATITLTAKEGYTLQGVTANFFTVAGAMSVSNSANSGVITVVFPATVSTDGSFTHQVTIDMYDSYGDGWNGCALRININGINLSSNATISSGSSGSYTFNVVSGDSVSIYWVSGDYQDECSFIVYYTDTPPSPAFTTSNNDYWNGANALVYELQGTMNGISGGTLLGSFTVQNGNIDVDTIINIAAIQGVTVPVTGAIPVTSITENEQYSGIVTWSGNPSVFAAATQYTATITLTPKTDYTLQGVSSNFFTVAGATYVSNYSNSGVITAVFPQTAAIVIDIPAIQGVTAPVTGVIPVTSITANEQYSGTVTWNGNPSTFAAETQYTATITLTAKTGYTLQGVTYNFFTVAGATSVSNSANSGVITATFPRTNALMPANRIEYYWIDQHGSLVTTSGGAVTVAAGATLTITAQSAGYVVKQWYLDGVNTGQSGNTYSFSSTTAGKHTVGLFVEKNGRVYNTNITITVNSVTVTYNVNGGTGTTPSAQTASAGSSITLNSGSGLSRTGYTFNGWNIEAAGTGTNYAASSSFTPTGNITLYARWTSTVTFNINSGTGTAPTSQTVSAGSSIMLPGGTGLTRTGYIFSGWNTNSSGTGTNYNADSFYTPTGNITLYAKWLTSVTVTFNVNSGTGTAPTTQTVVAGSVITLPSGSGLSRTGYTFSGWNTNSSGTGTNYNAGDIYVTPTSNITLYARWTTTVTVTFNINSGTGTTPSSQTVIDGSVITLPDGSGFTRSSYTFSGWNTNSSGTGTNYNAGASYIVPTSNITLYAKWIINPISLTVSTWTDGNIQSSGGVQWFSFTATATTQYIHVSFGTLSDLYVQLYDSSGTTTVGAQTNMYSSTKSASRTLTVGQVYCVKVWPYSSTGSGTYKITFNTSSTAPAL
ncbi:beta strand repeat-containing protein [Treponema sp. R80B11-R83G3]